MITNTGKKIITKYLIGQVPSYASYIALGCGSTPLSAAPTAGTYLEKTSLDFEMFRVPVTSRGYVVENGIQKIVLTAQLPAEERYDITEVGLYPAESNPVAVGYDSKTIYSFNQNEIWERHIGANKGTIPKVTEKLSISNTITPKLLIDDAAVISNVSGPASSLWTATISGLSNTENIIIGDTIIATDAVTAPIGSLGAGTVTVTEIGTDYIVVSSTATMTAGNIINLYNNNIMIFQADSDNTTFSEEVRLKRFERPRFFNNAIFIRGNSCSIADTTFALTGTTNHIHLNNINLDLSRNSPLDEIRVAFSVINKNLTDSAPSKVKIILEFAGVDGTGLSTANYAKANILINGGMTSNRYFVASIPIKDLVTNNFAWTSVKSVKIYSSVEVSETASATSADYYVALDAIRVENVASTSAVYGLTGYSVIVNTAKDSTNAEYPSAIVKENNTSNFIEFRFVADVT